MSCGSLHMAVISSQNQNQQHMTDGEPNGMDGLYAKDTHGRTILQRSVRISFVAVLFEMT